MRSLYRSAVVVACCSALLVGGTPVLAGSRPDRTASGGNWPQFHFFVDHAGVNPYETVLSTSTVSGLHQIWVAPTGGFIGLSAPSVENGIVYIGSYDHKVHAFDEATGSEIWQSVDMGDLAESSPAYAQGTVYELANNGMLFALDASSGATDWSVFADVEAAVSSPTVYRGVVYQAAGFTAKAYDAASGALLWTTPLPKNMGPRSAATVSHGMVFIASGTKVIALDAATGTKRWSHLFHNESFQLSTPAVANGLLYVGAGAVYALKLQTGAIVWQQSEGGLFDSSPAVSASGVYFSNYGNGSDQTWAFDPLTGAVLWTASGGGGVSAVTLANGVVYSASLYGDAVSAFDAQTGATLWTSPTIAANIQSSPTVVDGMLFIGADDNNVYAYGL